MDSDTVVVQRLPTPPNQPAAPDDGRSRWSSGFSLLAKVVTNLLVLAMFAMALVMLLPAVLGLHRYVILTGSMTGTYDRGSIVFDRPFPVAQLRVGDPITYSPPPGFTGQARVTHRIFSIGRGPNGERVFRTKGDANKAPDVWRFMLNRPSIDRVVFSIPYLGYVFMALQVRLFRIILMGIPALLIAALALRGLWREAGQEARRQRLANHGWQTVEGGDSLAILAPIAVPADHVAPVHVALGLSPSASRPCSRAAPLPIDASRLARGHTLTVSRIALRRRRGGSVRLSLPIAGKGGAGGQRSARP